MMIRQIDASESDKKSAQAFFTAVQDIYDVRKMRVLDAFARNGQLTVSSYRKYDPKWLECWELSEEHESDLTAFADSIRIGDSYEHLRKTLGLQRPPTYDMIVIDTPQGLHKDSTGALHAEHFDFFRQSLPLIKDMTLVVLYVNKRPYNREVMGNHGLDHYEEYNYEKWMRAREAFYGAAFITEDMALAAYRRLIEEKGYHLSSVLALPCYSDVEGLPPYSLRVALEIHR